MSHNEEKQAQLLGDWLDGPDDADLPAIDADVLEAMFALRPDLAPPPAVTADEILGLVEQGPLVSGAVDAAVDDGGGEVVPFPGAPTVTEAPPPVVVEDEAPIELTPANRPWYRSRLLGGGVVTVLAVAATMLVILTPYMQGEFDDAPAAVSSPAAPERMADQSVARKADKEQVEKAAISGDEAAELPKGRMVETEEEDEVAAGGLARARQARRPSPRPAPAPAPSAGSGWGFASGPSSSSSTAPMNSAAPPAPPPPPADPAPVIVGGDYEADLRSEGVASGLLGNTGSAGGQGLDQLGYRSIVEATQPTAAGGEYADDPSYADDIVALEDEDYDAAEEPEPEPELAAAPEPAAAPAADYGYAEVETVSAGRSVRSKDKSYKQESARKSKPKRDSRSRGGGGGGFGMKKKPSAAMPMEMEERQAARDVDLGTLRAQAMPTDLSRDGWRSQTDDATEQRLDEAIEDAEELKSKGQYNAAGDRLYDASTPPPRAAQSLLIMSAEAYLAKNNTSAALQAVQGGLAQSTSNSPERAYLLVLLGDTHRRMGDEDSARSAYEQAIALNRDR